MAKISAIMKKIIKRCKKSPAFFIENFCKVRHPMAGVIPFNLFRYQKHSLSKFRKHQYTIYRKCRQCGISTLTGAYALWLVMFQNHKTVLIVSKRDEDAKEYLAKNVKFVYEYLPDAFKRIWGDPEGKLEKTPPIYSQHQIIFSNGSSIKSLTSAPNTLRSNSSTLNIIDEAAFMPDMDAMWCVAPDTLISSKEAGIIQIVDAEKNMCVASKNGYNKCQKIHRRSDVNVMKITTTGGYSITAGLNHKLMYDHEWKKVQNLEVGDKLDLKMDFAENKDPIRLGRPWSNFDLPEVLNESLAKVLGLFVGDGSFSEHRPKRFLIHCNSSEVDVLFWLQKTFNSWGMKSYICEEENCSTFRVNSSKFLSFLTKNNLISKNNAHDAHVPALIMKSGRSVVGAFLCGLFSSDGHISNCRNLNYVRPVLSSVSKRLIREVQFLLLSIGIKSYIYPVKKKSSFGNSIYTLTIADRKSRSKFARHIGFMQRHKRSLCNKLLREDDGIGQISIVRIKSLEPDTIDVMDLTLSGDHSYVSNGFISHNSGGQPTLVHGGSVIVISTCLHHDTMIYTTDGMMAIGDYDKSKDQPEVATPFGKKKSDRKFKYENKDMLRLITHDGYELRGTPDHHLMVFDGHEFDWKKTKDIQPGNWLPLYIPDLWGNNDSTDFYDPQNNRATWNPNRHIDDDLAYLMGLILAEGYINSDYVTISATEDEIIEFLLSSPCELNFKPDGDHNYRVCNRFFVRFLKQIGFRIGKGIKARHKIFPRGLLKCSKAKIASFIRGYADGDGYSRLRNGDVGFSSTSIDIVNILRHVLLNFGIFCRKLTTIEACAREFPDGSARECNTCYALDINSSFVDLYYDNIGFRLTRKQSNQKLVKNVHKLPIREICFRLYRSRRVSQSRLKTAYGLRACNLFFAKEKDCFTLDTALKFLKVVEYKDLHDYDLLRKIAFDDCHWAKVSSIERDVVADVYDIRVPDVSSYIANGFHVHNCHGLGNWYYNTWVDAEGHMNDFEPIQIDWWDMDWRLSFRDNIGQAHIIAPTAEMRKTDKDEEKKYGPKWSPWLEQQYRALQQKGEAHLFRQEVLAEFLGSGNTVVDRETLIYISQTKNDKFRKVDKIDYEHPVSGMDMYLEFDKQLWIWKEPVLPTDDVIENGQIIKPGEPGHTYSMGVDVSSGEASDYSAIVIIDCTTKEQVAEVKIKVLPHQLVLMVDALARYYNNAFVVCERVGIGIPVAQEIYSVTNYSNVFRIRKPNGQRDKKIGFPTTATHKPTLNKCLMDMLGPDGFQVYSHRLYKELAIYVYLTQKQTGAEPGIGNHDDLVIACGLALVGVMDAVQMDMTSMIPSRGALVSYADADEVSDIKVIQKEMLKSGGINALLPVSHGTNPVPAAQSIAEEINNFAASLGGLTPQQAKERWLSSQPAAQVQKHLIDTGLNRRNISAAKHLRPQRPKIELDGSQGMAL